ncbi:MAG: OmpA family protein [Deltaproteobacteria bacterium]|nr:OmpA family protein [Deltaproteobacteria bacterium]
MKKNTLKIKSFFPFSVTVAFVLCALSGTPALAKKQQQIPTNMLEPAPGNSNFLAVESPELGENNKPSAGFVASYQHRPFVTLACDSNGDCGDDITISQVQATIDNVEGVIISDILFRYNFLKRFQAGIAVPVYAWQSGFVPEEKSNAFTGERWVEADADTRYNAFGIVGDIRIHLKARIWGKENKDGFVVSAALIPTIPMTRLTKQGKGYAGSNNVTVTPKGLVSFRKGPFRAMANLGFKVREKLEYYSAVLGHAITYAGGAGYELAVKPNTFTIEFFGELYGEKNVVSDNFFDMESAPLLFDGGAKFNVKKDFQFVLAVGGGIISGIGVPQIQGILGFNWTGSTKRDPNAFYVVSEDDVDGDTIDNNSDECPENPEDLDGFQDEDGCPDPDNDQDGIQDGYDSCMNEPEDKDGFRDDDGCPDLDHDEDGIKEPTDQCPDKAEDYDSFEDEDGCPDPDNDNDGVLDADDYCPSAMEDKDGFEDEDGCPEIDNDDDGVPDSKDKCPNEKETLNGVDDGDGCAEAKAALVEITPEAFILTNELIFKQRKSIFKDREVAYETLDIIAGVLKGNNTWKLKVSAHTAATEDPEGDKVVTTDRANAIKDYLVKQGVDGANISIESHGGTVPLSDNSTRDGRMTNNRVDLLIERPPTKPADTSAAGAGEGGDDTMDFTDDGGESVDTMDFSVGGGSGDAQGNSGGDEDSMDFSEDDF